MVSASVSAIRSMTGAISMTSTRGTVPSIEAQKVRMPARVIEISAASPDRMSRPTIHQTEAAAGNGNGNGKRE